MALPHGGSGTPIQLPPAALARDVPAAQPPPAPLAPLLRPQSAEAAEAGAAGAEQPVDAEALLAQLLRTSSDEFMARIS